MSTSEYDPDDPLHPTIRLLLGLSIDGEEGADLPIEISDDFRLHLISGVPGLRGTYNGRDRVVELLRTVYRGVDGAMDIDIRHIAPPDFGPDDALLVTLSTLTVGDDDHKRSYELCSVARHEDGRAREAWVISSSVSDLRAGDFIRVARSISKPFSLSCSSCGHSSDVSIGKLGRMLLPPTVWFPMRGSYPLWTKCPNCGDRTWMAVEIPVLGSALKAFDRSG